MPRLSQKHLLIDQAAKRVIIATSIAAFVVVFSAVASQALFSQLRYQNRVIGDKKNALTQLKKNKEAVTSLNDTYTNFVASEQNAIGGSSTGNGNRDGDNAKIVLDALPSKYDFPALATSLEKILKTQNIKIQSISGIDDEVAQASVAPSGAPEAVPIPFDLTASGNYDSVKNVTKTFESSIRPIQIQNMTLSGNNSDLMITVTAQTYYQPGKAFIIGKKEVK